MQFILCPACGAEILDLEEAVLSETEGIRNFHHKLLYDLIIKEEKRIKKLDISEDYRLCKALAACFELQDYLANIISVESPEEC